MNILFEVPTSLSRHIIVSWLDMIDVVRLDSSCCSRRTNKDLRSILSDEGTRLEHTDWSLRKTKYPNNADQKRVIDWILSRDVSIRAMWLHHPMDLDWAHLHAFIQQRGRDLQELTYIRMPQQEGREDILEEIITNCTNLEKVKMQALDVHYFTGETPDSGPVFDGALCGLFCAFTKLRSVNLSKSEASNDALVGLAAARPGLETLLLAECINVGDAGVRAIAQSCPALREIDLSHTVCTDEALTALSEHCHELRTFTLGLNARDFSDGVTALSAGCPKLESFTCSDFTLLEGPAVESLARNCRHLQTLKLGKHVHLTDSAVRAIADHCCDLRSVQLTSLTESILPETVLKLAQACKKIHTLSLGHLECSDGTALHQFAAHCPLLTTVHLTFTPLATDAFIVALVQSARRLQSLRTVYCKNITAACLDAIATHCPHIRRLLLSDTAITVAEMEVLLARCPQLGRNARKLLVIGC
jgi:hypothetical protein